MSVVLQVGLIVGMVVAAGCVSADVQRARAVQNGLVGLTREQVLACAGQPQGESQAGDLRTLTYYRSCGMLEQEFPTTRGTMARQARHGCQATVEFEAGLVRRAQFRPVPDGAAYEMYHCEELFAACASGPDAAK